VPNHPRARLEKANLLIDRGLLAEAHQFLEDSIKLFPAVPGLRQSLARANREIARRQSIRFDQERYAALTKPLLELQRRNSAFQPLAYLERGRICLAMHDGQVLRNTAARDLGQLRKYTADKPQDGSEFSAWWNEKIQRLLFSSLPSEAPLTGENVGTVERCLQENEQLVDVLAEDFTIRMSL
jgi:hypothetical protein